MPVRVFFSYSQKDEALCQELEAQLAVLRSKGILMTWHARKVVPGDEQRAAVDREIEAADLVLLLVSADFLASDYKAGTEVKRALERHEAGSARVVPVVLRPCLWEEAEFGKLAPLPGGGQPITRWEDRDEAWLAVARGVRELVRSPPPTEKAQAPTAEEPREGSERTKRKGAPIAARPEVEQWLRELEGAQAEKDVVARRGEETGALQSKIDELKRRLREGGQLQQNDSLGDGRYFLLRPLGRGGFATVWEADDRTTGTRVAIKVLHPHFANDPARRERFFRGARAMAKLDHSNVVRVLVPYEEDAGFLYFVMELFTGGDLHKAVLERRIDRSRVVPLILEVGGALALAHETGFVHRDISPHNILLGANGEAKLSDFDLVAAEGTTGGTRTGAMGKFLYAAPEAMSRPQDADARADVFGLGMTAIFCLHGADLPTNVLRKPEQLLAKLNCGPLAPVLKKAIEWEADDRYPSARAFCEALAAAMPRPRRKLVWVGGGVVALIAAVGLGVKYWPGDKGPTPPVTPATATAGVTTTTPSATASAAPTAAPAKFSPCPAEMVVIPAGTFRMGSDTDDKDADADEKPAHEVTLSAFCIDVTEVTVAAYRKCTKEARNGVTCQPAAGAEVSQFCNGDRTDRDKHPINCVDWKTADTYCKWAGGALPTEAQWEYAARGKERRKYPWANNDAPGPTLLNACGSECREMGKKLGQTWNVMYESDDSNGATAPVKSYAKGATPEGVYDMAGNVWEWVQDMKGDYTAAPSTDPVQTKGTLRVLRGGGWRSVAPRWVRAAVRDGYDAGNRINYVGFRCARPPNP